MRADTTEPVDIAAVHADDHLINRIAAGRTTDGDQLEQMLAAWVAHTTPPHLHPDAPVDPPAGMTTADCLTHRARQAEQHRHDLLGEIRARLNGRTPSPAVLAAEDRDQHRIAHAETHRPRENW